jgi:hypothetical protein
MVRPPGKSLQPGTAFRRYLLQPFDPACGDCYLRSLAHLAATLADSEPEQAVELYALAKRHPYVSNSRLWHDLLETRVAATAATLPQDIVQVAQARGQEGDWVTAAEYWIKELGAD